MATISSPSGGGNDWLIGAGGDDTIIGSSSASTMEGGLGNDTYFVADPSDFVIDPSGGGSDRIAATASYTLPGKCRGGDARGEPPERPTR